MNPLTRIIQDKYLSTFLMCETPALDTINRLETVSKIALFEILAIELERRNAIYFKMSLQVGKDKTGNCAGVPTKGQT